MILGFFIIAEDASGVIHDCFGDHSYFVQTYNQWFKKERIQSVIIEKLIPKFQKLRISLTTLDSASRGSNGTSNTYNKIGSSLKFMGFMVANAYEPKLKVR